MKSKIPILINPQTPCEFVGEFVRAGFDPLPVPLCRSLAAPVAGHPDLLFFRCGNRLVCNGEYFSENRKYLDSILADYIGKGALRLILSGERLSDKYPDDIALSAAVVGRFMFCRTDCVSAAVSECAAAFELELVDVRQGYAGCAVCAVSESGGGAIITADAGIAAAARARGVEVLEITPGFINLPGYACGFIGGASFAYGGAVLFTGDLRSHPDGIRIADFCRSHSREAVSLGSGGLWDYGSPVVVGHIF